MVFQETSEGFQQGLATVPEAEFDHKRTWPKPSWSTLRTSPKENHGLL